MLPRPDPRPASLALDAGRFSPWTLHVLMFGSGAIALVYEVLWMRRFTALFGASTPAVVATLSAMFLGLTLGSLAFARIASRSRSPLRGYGLLELGVGIGALLVQPLLALYDRRYPSLYQSLSDSEGSFVVLKTLLAVLALFLPTFCMGGTLPLMGQTIDRHCGRLGITAGGLYAMNILGAALGALSVPFFWLRTFSANSSYLACVAGSLVLGVIAIALGARKGPESAPVPAAPPAPASRDPSRLPAPAVGGLAFLSGLIAFVLQVAWNRMFAQVHENSIHAFAFIVALVLAGLGAGAAIARAGLRRSWNARGMLATAWILAGIVILLSPRLFLALTGGMAYTTGAGEWARQGLHLFWTAVPTVLLPTVLAGMGMPVLMELAARARPKEAGNILGRLIAFNTAGAILGAITGAFVLPHVLGLWGTLAAAGGMLLIAGAACVRLDRSRAAHPLRGVAFGSAAVLVLILVTGPFDAPRTRLDPARQERLLSLRESGYGIVAVVEDATRRQIRLNNHYVLGGSASTGDERMQAHLPILLHPAPKKVAFLGLGTGITAGAALLHPIENVTVLELVPEVIDAARRHFSDDNLGIVDSSRARVFPEDARNHMRGSTEKFDVIIGDLVVPWRPGESSLYTLEHFRAVRIALEPGGLFCQWLPLFQMSEEEFNIVAATFLDVFPHATLWRGDFAPDRPAVALVAGRDALTFYPVVVDRRIKEMRPDPANPFLVHSAGFWMFLGGELNPADPRFLNARRNRENEPWLEVLAPIAHAGSNKAASALFVGARLEAFLSGLKSRITEGGPLGRIGNDPLQWRDAGGDVRESSIHLAAGNRTAARAAMDRAAAKLPPEIHRAVFGDTVLSVP